MSDRQPDELDLSEFQNSLLFDLDLDSLNESKLIESYYAIKNAKFSFMESLIGHLINSSSIDSVSQQLFQRFDNLLSNVLIKIKDDSKLMNHELGRNGFASGNGSVNSVKIDGDSVQISDGRLNDSVIEDGESSKAKLKNEILLSSDDEDFDINLIPCEEAASNLDFNIIISDDEDSNESDLQRIYVNSSNKPKYLKRDYPFSKNLFSAFYNVFGLKSFRPYQFECINSALLNEDLFILMPTGKQIDRFM